MGSKDIKYWVGFSLVPGVGRVRFAKLENYFGSLEGAWRAEPAELKRAGLDSRVVRAITATRPKLSLEAEMEKLKRYGVKVFRHNDPEYPARLKEIYDYPPVLYVRGSLLPEDEWCLAVVGTRRATVYGRQVTEELVTDLARSRITIVSGLARGIDSIAHLDEVCRSSKLPVSQVSSTLAMMELKGLVRQVGTMSYVLAREARQEYRVGVD